MTLFLNYSGSIASNIMTSVYDELKSISTKSVMTSHDIHLSELKYNPMNVRRARNRTRNL